MWKKDKSMSPPPPQSLSFKLLGRSLDVRQEYMLIMKHMCHRV